MSGIGIQITHIPTPDCDAGCDYCDGLVYPEEQGLEYE